MKKDLAQSVRNHKRPAKQNIKQLQTMADVVASKQQESICIDGKLLSRTISELKKEIKKIKPSKVLGMLAL